MIKADYRGYVITYSETLNVWEVDVSGVRERFYSLTDAKTLIDELQEDGASPVEALVRWRDKNENRKKERK